MKALAFALLFALILANPYWSFGFAQSYGDETFESFFSVFEVLEALALAPLLENIPLMIIVVLASKAIGHKGVLIFLCTVMCGAYGFLSHGSDLGALNGAVLFAGIGALFAKKLSMGFKIAFIETAIVHFAFNVASLAISVALLLIY